MTKLLKISIIDYGVGNLHSLLKAVQHFTENVQITDDKDEIRQSDALILPGVGSFQAGMDGLAVRDLTSEVIQFAKNGKPILGICLGAQIMMDKGFEFGEFAGLGLIPGCVIPFPKLPEKEKIPQVGWNKIYPPTPRDWKNSILQDIASDSSVYFVHSYILEPEKKDNILALASYGGYEFCAAIQHGNIFGCQFHPEKSGEIGLNIIKKFIELI